MESMAPRLARHVKALTYETLPAQVVEIAKRCVLDYLGVMLRGSTLPQVQAPYALVRDMAARPESTIGGYGVKTTAAYAAYVNGTFGHSCEFDDGHALGGHPGVVVIPTVLALAEAGQRSGKETINAIVAGYETMVLSLACIHTASLHLGWHAMKIQGVFGAAGATAKLLDLEEGEIVNAFGIAGSEVSGVMEYDQSGGEVKRLHAGSTARLGMQSAQLAHHGLTGPSTICEGKRGIWRMYSDKFDADPESFWTGQFYILDTIVKMSPAVGTVHGAIDAAHEIRRRHGVKAEDIAKIDAYVSALTMDHGASIVRPHDCIGAQFSLAFSLGLSFVKGANLLTDYLEPSNWSDPAIMAIAEKVTPIERPTAPGASVLGALVKVTLKDGQVLEFDQPLPRGHPKNPPSMADVEAKFRGLVGGLLPDAQADAIVAAVAKLEAMDDVSELMKLLVLPQGLTDPKSRDHPPKIPAI